MDFESLTLTITSDTIKDNVPVASTLVLRGCDKDKKLLTTAACRSGKLEARKTLYIQAFPEYLKRTVVCHTRVGSTFRNNNSVGDRNKVCLALPGK